MGISSATGLISGLDVNQLITASMAFDKLSLTRLQTQLSSTQGQISAMGKVKSAIASLQEASKKLADTGTLTAFKGAFSKDDFGSAAIEGNAASGKYSVSVDTLATSHRLTLSSLTTSGGPLKIEVGGKSVDIDVAAGASMTAVAKAINERSDAGVTAAVINGDGGSQQLVLTSKETGTANKMTLGGFAFNVASDNATSVQDAVIKINGIQITSASNTVKDAMAGVTLTLKSTGTSELTISSDSSDMETRVKAFVDAYNSARNTMKSLSQYDVEGKGKNSGALSGNGTVSSAMNELRGLLSRAPAGVSDAYPNLSFLGVKTTSSGTLEFDASKLKSASETNFAAASKTLSAYASAFDATTTRMNSSDGIITRQVDGLNSTSRRISDGISAQERRLDIVQKRYEKQFANMEKLLSKMQEDGNKLSQQLASLSKSR